MLKMCSKYFSFINFDDSFGKLHSWWNFPETYQSVLIRGGGGVKEMIWIQLIHFDCIRVIGKPGNNKSTQLYLKYSLSTTFLLSTLMTYLRNIWNWPVSGSQILWIWGNFHGNTENNKSILTCLKHSWSTSVLLTLMTCQKHIKSTWSRGSNNGHEQKLFTFTG